MVAGAPRGAMRPPAPQPPRRREPAGHQRRLPATGADAPSRPRRSRRVRSQLGGPGFNSSGIRCGRRVHRKSSADAPRFARGDAARWFPPFRLSEWFVQRGAASAAGGATACAWPASLRPHPFPRPRGRPARFGPPVARLVAAVVHPWRSQGLEPMQRPGAVPGRDDPSQILSPRTNGGNGIRAQALGTRGDGFRAGGLWPCALSPPDARRAHPVPPHPGSPARSVTVRAPVAPGCSRRPRDDQPLHPG